MTNQDTGQRRLIDLIVVEDSAVDAELVINALQEAGLAVAARRVETEPAFRAALDERLPDIILADWTLPHFSGRGALAIARERCPAVPFIFVSGTISEASAIDVLRQGATDYVYKHQLPQLGPILMHALDEVRALGALHESEKKYRQLFESSRDALMLLMPPSWRFTDANQATLQLFGAANKDDFTAFAPWDVSPERQPDGRPSAAKSLEMIATAVREGSHFFEWEHRRLNGATFAAETVLTAIELDGQPVLQATVRDITKRKLAEGELRRLNRTLRTLSACNVALVRAGNETELFDSICRLIVETGGYRMAWVGLPEPGAEMTARPVAQYGHDEGHLATANSSWAECARGHSPSGTAIRTGTVQLNQNFLTAPALTAWREAAQLRGYQSSIALPIKSSAGTLGVLTLYASEPDAFNEAEVRLLQELADDLAFGIETLRTRAERDRGVHEQLHHAELLRQSLEDSIKAIADTVEIRDAYTAGHQRRVGQLAVAMARELGLPEDTIRGIELAASIHDFGKISIPAEILSKPTKLTAIEFLFIKNHPQAGFDILKDIKFPWPIATMVWQHHERLDGSGYPQGLKGEEILLESRIVAVADVVEAMASHRPYRAALGIDLALAEIKRGRGTAFDAAVVDACIRLFAEKRFAFSS